MKKLEIVRKDYFGVIRDSQEKLISVELISAATPAINPQAQMTTTCTHTYVHTHMQHICTHTGEPQQTHTLR